MAMNNSNFGTGAGGNNPRQPYNDDDQPATNQAPKPPSPTPAAPVPNDPNSGYGYPYKRVK